MVKAADLYLVFDDELGNFVHIDDIQAVVHNDDGGSRILLRGGSHVFSKLKPREVLRRITIIRYKGKLDETPPESSPGSSKLAAGRGKQLDTADTHG